MYLVEPNRKNSPSILVLFAQYDPEKHSGSFNHFRQLVDRLSPQTDYLIINNRANSYYQTEREGKAVEISGDNSSYEFSAWAKGLQWAEEQGRNYDIVLLTNDAYKLNENEYSAYLVPGTAQFVHRHRISSGLIYVRNALRRPASLAAFKPIEYQLCEHRFNFWVRSNLVLIPFDIAKKIDLKPICRETFFHKSLIKGIFRDESPVSQSLKEQITKYLCPDEPYDPKLIWHSHFTLSETTYPLFVDKARSILNEMMLAQTLAETGSPVVDIRTIAALRLVESISKSGLKEYMRIIHKVPAVQPYILFPYKRLMKLMNWVHGRRSTLKVS